MAWMNEQGLGESYLGSGPNLPIFEVATSYCKKIWGHWNMLMKSVGPSLRVCLILFAVYGVQIGAHQSFHLLGYIDWCCIGALDRRRVLQWDSSESNLGELTLGILNRKSWTISGNVGHQSLQVLSSLRLSNANLVKHLRETWLVIKLWKLSYLTRYERACMDSLALTEKVRQIPFSSLWGLQPL